MAIQKTDISTFSAGTHPGADALNLNWTNIKTMLWALVDWFNSKMDATNNYAANTIPGSALNDSSVGEAKFDSATLAKLNAVSAANMTLATAQDVTGVKTFKADVVMQKDAIYPAKSIVQDIASSTLDLTDCRVALVMEAGGATLSIKSISMTDGAICTVLANAGGGSIQFTSGGNIYLPKGGFTIPKYGAVTFYAQSGSVYIMGVYGI